MARRDAGQAMVETAIVLPLFVFMVLGTFQLGLMHQARLLTKYAAYKATRAGSIHSAKPNVIQAAALATLLPIIARTVSGGETFFKTTDASGATNAFNKFWGGPMGPNNHEGTSLPVLTVTICNPTSGNADTGDFDYPSGDVTSWKGDDQTKLSVQVLLNYRMVIPFANMVLWHITRGDENSQMLRITRLGTKSLKKLASMDNYQSAADNHIYLMPIRANWNMRMQSNFLSSYPLPSNNDCVIPFPKE